MGKAASKHMVKGRSGLIINISSTAQLGNVGQSNYAAAKAGVVGLTRTWAKELGRYGIRSNAIAPGFIDTTMTRGMPKGIKERIIRALPLRRIGQPQEVAQAIWFLWQAEYITGQTIYVDGGLSAGMARL